MRGDRVRRDDAGPVGNGVGPGRAQAHPAFIGGLSGKRAQAQFAHARAQAQRAHRGPERGAPALGPSASGRSFPAFPEAERDRAQRPARLATHAHAARTFERPLIADPNERDTIAAQGHNAQRHAERSYPRDPASGARDADPLDTEAHGLALAPRRRNNHGPERRPQRGPQRRAQDRNTLRARDTLSRRPRDTLNPLDAEEC
ncbi:MAG: hypothetical protein HRU70_06355 [Phycisphaeraceae bacterium]|nr:MAG: hypothetical protein HRU70_06355 [Phycisphaeraceae bacterium]